MYSIGFDIGSSSIKASIVDLATNKSIGLVKSPEKELDIHSLKDDWAEQDPDIWWEHMKKTSHLLLQNTGVDKSDIRSIGMSYQMHGLVLVDKNLELLRHSIIWCDSRAVNIGNKMTEFLGEEYCFNNLLNSPGNFTAAKLKWVQENEPEVFEKVAYYMLPGDYLALKMSGEVSTTLTGLSEGIFLDFQSGSVSDILFDKMGFSKSMTPVIKNNFECQCVLSSKAAEEMGLAEGTPVTYRAGDQPNNALSLGVLSPGETAATAGTSGVVYGVNGSPISDKLGRFNSFAHANYSKENPMTGALLCINGVGSMYRWIKDVVGVDLSYEWLENIANKVESGSNGVMIFPFGNGAERMLSNKEPLAQIHGISLNRHSNSQLIRASLEGIAFAFNYGLKIMIEAGLPISSFRVGNDNLFQSRVFSQTLANLSGAQIDMVETTGAIGAARAAGYGISAFNSLQEAMEGDKVLDSFYPKDDLVISDVYQNWENKLNKIIETI